MSFSFLLITSQQSIKCSGSPRSSLFWAIMHLTVVQSLSQKVQTNVSPLRILNLQSGQVAFVWSQRPMHSQWKWCVQGRRYSSAPSTYGQRQIQHSYNIIRSSSVIFQQLHDAFQLYAKQQRIRASRFHVVTSLRQFSLQFSLCISGCNQVHFRKNPLPRILEHQLHNSQSLCLQFGSFLVHREWFRHELHH